MSVLDKVRRWIDGESAEMVLEEAARNAQIKPRSQSEEFIVKIARAVEDVMQREMVPLPQGTTIIPTEYMIFLSSEDDKDWQGIKRKGLEQGLYHILAERAREISGKKKLETKTFVVELRVDGTLEKGDVRVQHSWEDSAGNKTNFLTRPKSIDVQNEQIAANRQFGTPNSTIQNDQNNQNNYQPPLTSPNFVGTQTNSQVKQSVFNATENVPAAMPSTFNESEEMTHVQQRHKELYRLEVWRDGVRQSVLPIFQNEIFIGRGSKSQPVDVALNGDPEISRRHITLTTDGAGNYWVTNQGRNPAMVNNYELPSGQKVGVSAGMPISVCSFILRIQPS